METTTEKLFKRAIKTMMMVKVTRAEITFKRIISNQLWDVTIENASGSQTAPTNPVKSDLIAYAKCVIDSDYKVLLDGFGCHCLFKLDVTNSNVQISLHKISTEVLEQGYLAYKELP